MERVDGAVRRVAEQNVPVWPSVWLVPWWLQFGVAWLHDADRRAAHIDHWLDINHKASAAYTEAGRLAVHAADRAVLTTRTLFGLALEPSLRAIGQMRASAESLQAARPSSEASSVSNASAVSVRVGSEPA